MRELALIYIGGVMATLPCIEETEDWKGFLTVVIQWPLFHASALLVKIAHILREGQP
jgi:hypothetical protein